MSLSNVIPQFAGALEETRNKLNAVQAEIDQIAQERGLIEQAKPHTSDIVSAYTRSLKAQHDQFKGQFAAFLKATFVVPDDAARRAHATAYDILRLPATPPDNGIGSIGQARALPEINTAAIAYFLGEQIAQTMPGLIDELCPGARDGMKAADRAAKLAALDKRLADLTKERSALQAELEAARQAIFPN
jgi:prefoldin subunit 5